MLSELVNGILNRSKNSGAQAPARAAQSGETVTTDAHGRYQEAVIQGNVYTASMTAAAAMGTALTATAVTITIYNPATSGINLSLLNVNGILATVGAGATQIVLVANNNPLAAAPVTNTPIIVKNCLLGGTTGKGVAYSATTLPAVPTIIKSLLGIHATGNIGNSSIDVDIAGGIILSPNTAVTIQGITTAANGIWSMTWEEIPA